ncbi:MAG: glycosyltransferase [Chloroflexota bacterium]
MIGRALLLAFATVQAAAAVRVFLRMARTAGGAPVAPSSRPAPGERITVIVPVLDEQDRLAPCLEGLVLQPAEVAEILVSDGGSRDATREIIDAFARRDPRVRLVDAAPIPHGWNGKAHGLQTALLAADPASRWMLTIDADVRVQPDLARSLLAEIRRSGAGTTSLATRQRLSGPADGLIHPAFLASLVYRHGIPGLDTSDRSLVLASGQCAIYDRAALLAVGGFAAGRDSVCEDVTIARAIAAAGHLVGFHEGGPLAETAMYRDWRETWTNWSRSLPMRDRYLDREALLLLAEATLVQAAPLPLALLTLRSGGPAAALNRGLLAARLGVLAGAARAYPDRPATYWLSPLLDIPATFALWRSALRRDHNWRGRTLVRGASGRQP